MAINSGEHEALGPDSGNLSSPDDGLQRAAEIPQGLSQDGELEYSIEASAADFPADLEGASFRYLGLRQSQGEQGTTLDRLSELDRETRNQFLTLLRFHDGETEDHMERVGLYSEIIARNIGLNGRDCYEISLAAPLHDIGKIAILDSILQKPSKLESAELELMRRHAEIGAEILSQSSSSIMRLAAEISMSHHEWWNGDGYPHRLTGNAIPLSGRIVSIADVFDALTSDRPYKRAWSFSEAVEYVIGRSGIQFDPLCVGAFSAGLDDVERVFSARRWNAQVDFDDRLQLKLALVASP